MSKTKKRPDWSEVGRTVNGVPVDGDQIDMIVKKIRDSLGLHKDDVLLDIGCGNGELSKHFFDDVSCFIGIDSDPKMIERTTRIPRRNSVLFSHENVKNISKWQCPEVITKVLCYGAFSYMPDYLPELRKFPNVKKVFIGNLPDKSRSHKFLTTEMDMDDPKTPIGIWRTMDEFTDLANKAGWKVDFSVMPTEFYASHYRYDALLL